MQLDNELKTLIASINLKERYIYSENDLRGIKAYEELKTRPEKEQKEIILCLSSLALEYSIIEAKARSQNSHNYDAINARETGLAIQSGLLRRKLNYTEEAWITLFKSFRNFTDRLAEHPNSRPSLYLLPVNHAIKQLEYYLKKHEPSEKLTAFLKEVLAWKELDVSTQRNTYGSDLAKAAKKLRSFLLKEGEIHAFHLKTDDIGDEVNQIIDSIAENRQAFDQIFHLASSASGGKPSQKFSKEIDELQDQIGLNTYRKTAHQLLDIALQFDIYEKENSYEHQGQIHTYCVTTYLCKPSQQFIKGIVWTMVRFSDKESIQLLRKLCEKSYAKIPGQGPAAASIGNACAYVLGNMRGKDGLGALSFLKLKLRQNNIRKTIDKYLTEGAKKYNVSVEELKEMAVPDFKLEQGSKTVEFEDYQLSVFIEGRKVIQQWIKPDGNPMKSVPASVKSSSALSQKLKEIRKEVKEIQKVYAAQKQRIDNQFILNRSWDFPSFRKYYLKHGLVYPITQKLIWTFTKDQKSADAILLDDKWYSFEHDLIDWIDDDTTVRLWHPVNASEKDILTWREKMMELEWKQPIKQAFREIYILTDAEINTRTYSNRMAAHILKQHQFNALAGLRGWKYSLMGAYDDGRDSEICQKHLPEYQITAQYWIDELNQDDAWNDAGIWLYVATDQVRFKDGNNQLMELVDVPKIVFTEIMRDVDLFVGVCSVGNDPQWMDNNGERQTNRDYWTSYSFGDLTELAKTRKSILERLLPRLKKIRDKAHIDGRFLIVKGKLRTYKIHIGSGNILMEPNDQYLCIVPARSAENATDRIFIPFEGDKGLSIVLSKAFLLVEDDKITDSTITSQINRTL